MKKSADTKALLFLAAVGGLVVSTYAVAGFANGGFYGRPAYLPQAIAAFEPQALVSPGGNNPFRNGKYFNYPCAVAPSPDLEPYGFFIEQAKIGSEEYGKLADWLIDKSKTNANVLRSEKDGGGRGYSYIEYNFNGTDPVATEHKHMLIWESDGTKVVMLALDRCMSPGAAKEEMVRIADSMRSSRFEL